MITNLCCCSKGNNDLTVSKDWEVTGFSDEGFDWQNAHLSGLPYFFSIFGVSKSSDNDNTVYQCKEIHWCNSIPSGGDVSILDNYYLCELKMLSAIVPVALKVVWFGGSRTSILTSYLESAVKFHHTLSRYYSI